MENLKSVRELLNNINDPPPRCTSWVIDNVSEIIAALKLQIRLKEQILRRLGKFYWGRGCKRTELIFSFFKEIDP